jgi:hypothetical protein
MPTLNINTPQGVKNIDNPLFQYTFPYRDPNYFPADARDGFLAQNNTTIRDLFANNNLANDQLMINTVSDITLCYPDCENAK